MLFRCVVQLCTISIYSCKPQEKDWKRIPRTCNSNVKKETLQQEYVAGSPHTGRAVIMSSDLMISALLECSGHLRTSTVNFNRQKASESVKSHSTLIHSKLKLPSSCRQEFFCQWSTMLDCSFSSKKDIGYHWLLGSWGPYVGVCTGEAGDILNTNTLE